MWRRADTDRVMQRHGCPSAQVRILGGTTKGWDLLEPGVLSGRLVIEAGFELSSSP